MLSFSLLLSLHSIFYFLPYVYVVCEPDFFLLFTPGLIFILTTFNFHQNPRVTVKSFLLETETPLAFFLIISLTLHCPSVLLLTICRHPPSPAPHPSTSSAFRIAWLSLNEQQWRKFHISVQFF